MVSRSAYHLATLVCVLAVVSTLAWRVGTAHEERPSIPEPTASEAGRLAELAKLAEKGDPAAEYELATMYATGFGVTRNESDAHRWLERSAGHGNVAAQYELGLALRDGRGAVQDFRGSLRWMSLAAEAGFGRAQYSLGVMYRQGIGTPIDNVKAYTWLNLAAAQSVEGAAAARDAVRTQLSAAEIESAQTEARRLNVQQLRAPKTNLQAEGQ